MFCASIEKIVAYLRVRELHTQRMMNSQEIPGSIAVLLILLTVMIQMIWAKAMPWSWLLL